MLDETYNELFMLMSVDGKISTSDNDDFDFDKDLPLINGNVADGLYQYYDIEKETELWNVGTGKTMRKIGINNIDAFEEIRTIENLNLVIIDNYNLNKRGLINLAHKAGGRLIIATFNMNHIAVRMKDSDTLPPNVDIWVYNNYGSLIENLFKDLHKTYNVNKTTIQCGGEMNSILLRAGKINALNIVIVPLLVGGRSVSTLIDGKSISSLDELHSLSLESVNILKNGYIQLRYIVEV